MKEYIGITWDRSLQKWRSSVSKDGIKYECGYHVEQRDAVLARDKKIVKMGLNVKLQILKKVIL